MPSKTVKSRSRCLLCNCLSHSTERCNSNMNGRRALLQNICKDMMYDDKLMMDDKMPDFNSFPINELRYIILAYQGTLKNIMFPRTNYHPDIIKLMRTPIPLTLPKTRMIKELAIRWHYFQPVRQLKKMKPADGDDCPICMECMETPVWSSYRCRWNMMKAYVSPPDAMFKGNKVRTECGHEFCGNCWESHYKANYRVDYSYGGPNDRTYLSCPMCRHRMEC